MGEEVGLEVTCRMCHRDFELEVKAEDVVKYINGTLIQKAFPYLSAGERELLISHTCEECFNKLFPDEEDEESI